MIEGATGKFLLHQMASVAELEAGMISDRTRRALAAAKARGVKLGGFRGRAGTPDDCARARTARASKARAHAMSLAPILARLDPNSSLSLRMLASKLTAENLPTPAGGAEWTAATVARVKARLAGSGDRHPPQASDPLARSNYSKRDRTFAYKAFRDCTRGRSDHVGHRINLPAREFWREDRVQARSAIGKSPRSFALLMRVDRPIGSHRRRHVFVTQILAPRLDLSGRPTDRMHEMPKRMA